MLPNPLIVWVPALLMVILWRRDRRLLARIPTAAFVVGCPVFCAYAAYKLFPQPRPMSVADVQFVHALFLAGGACVLSQLVSWTRAAIRSDLPRLVGWWRREWSWGITVGLVALLAAAGYFLFGTLLASRGVFAGYDTLFETDPGRYTEILAGAANEAKHTTFKHPLFALIGHTCWYIPAIIIGPERAPLAVSSAAGGVAIALAACYFRRITGSRPLGVLVAGLLACTAGHIVLSSLPETATLSACSLILLHLLLAHKDGRAVRVRHQVVAAVFSAGMTITNGLAALVCFAARHAGQRRPRVLLRWAATTALVLCFGLVVQSTALPTSAIGQAPGEYASEAHYLRAPAIGEVCQNLSRGMLLQSVVGASVCVQSRPLGPVLAPGPYDTPAAITCVAVWLILAVGGTVAAVRGRAWAAPSFWAAAGCLVITAGIHTFYGHDHVFLYACSFTFYVLAIPAHGLRHMPRWLAVPAVATLLAVLLVRNACFAAAILRTLDQIIGG